MQLLFYLWGMLRLRRDLNHRVIAHLTKKHNRMA